MVICPQCNIEHNSPEEFCRKCGKFLLSVEDPLPEKEKPEVNLICLRCQLLYKMGKYCKQCGCPLIRRTPSQRTDVQPLEKKLVKRWTREWLDLLKEEKQLESYVSKLEAQGDNISVEVINPLMVRYKDRLASLSHLHQGIETELESIRKRASEEIDFLENQLSPVHKRLQEFQSLYKSSAVRKADFKKEKTELRKEIRSIERSLKKFRHILFLLPGQMGGRIDSAGLEGGLLRPLTWVTGGVVIFLIIAAGYLLWKQHPRSERSISKEVITSPSPPPSPPNPKTATESQDTEKIGSLFEDIRRANLQKNIVLFMSCFSRDFHGTEGKRKDTLKMWENFNFQDLSFELKKQMISGDIADVRLEWLVRTSEKAGGNLRDGKAVLDVTLKREDGHWKIKEIKPVG